jgi:hypothetical protein
MGRGLQSASQAPGNNTSDPFTLSDGFTTLDFHTPDTTLASHEAGNSTGVTLPVSDGVHMPDLTLLGQYSAASFSNPSTGPATAFVTPSLVGSAASPVLAAQHT